MKTGKKKINIEKQKKKSLYFQRERVYAKFLLFHDDNNTSFAFIFFGYVLGL
jgi:hypothetical protein